MIVKMTRFTKAGFEKIKKEYDELLDSRPKAVSELKKAREMGDLSENGYYKAARAKLSSIDSQLLKLDYQLKHSEIVENKDKDGIGIGNKVELSRDGKSYVYEIVGDLEANPQEKRISLLSPLGKAIEGKKAGDIAEFKTPKGIIKYIIKKIK